MNVIVEGIDKSGKSTIVKDLMEYLESESPIYMKISKKPSDDSFGERQAVIRMYEELFYQTGWVHNKDRTFIFDRSYPSEMVYSWKRGYDALSDNNLLSLDARLAENNHTFLIYCTTDMETIAKRFDTDKEEYLVKEDIQRTLERYEIFLAKTKLPLVVINSSDDRQYNLDRVKEFLKI